MNTTRSINTTESFSFMATVTVLATGELGWVTEVSNGKVEVILLANRQAKAYEPTELVRH